MPRNVQELRRRRLAMPLRAVRVLKQSLLYRPIPMEIPRTVAPPSMKILLAEAVAWSPVSRFTMLIPPPIRSRCPDSESPPLLTRPMPAPGDTKGTTLPWVPSSDGMRQRHIDRPREAGEVVVTSLRHEYRTNPPLGDQRIPGQMRVSDLHELRITSMGRQVVQRSGSLGLVATP